jgi:hypothetical protein
VGIRVDTRAGIDAAVDVIAGIKVVAGVDMDVDFVTYAYIDLDI